MGVLLGCQIEAAATFLCRLTELTTGKCSLLQQAFINSVLNAALTVMGVCVCSSNCESSSKSLVSGIHLTGMYCNPLIASACTWNCRRVSRWGHLVVYWGGPITGAYLAELMHSSR